MAPEDGTRVAPVEHILPEESLGHFVDLLVRITETAGALIIFAGVVMALARLALVAVHRDSERGFPRVRLGLARYLAVGLEFQLASDLLATAVAPSYEQIGKLAAVATIRTALNYFLAREIDKEQREMVGDDTAPVRKTVKK